VVNFGESQIIWMMLKRRSAPSDGYRYLTSAVNGED